MNKIIDFVCPKCGYEMASGNNRCPKCGESLVGVTPIAIKNNIAINLFR